MQPEFWLILANLIISTLTLMVVGIRFLPRMAEQEPKRPRFSGCEDDEWPYGEPPF